MSKYLLTVAVLIFLYGALLGFSIIDEPDLREDTAGVLFVGLACFASSFHPRAS